MSSSTYFFYKIHKPNLNYVYIGSTKDPRSRICVHRKQSEDSNVKLYKTIRDNGGWNSWRLDIIETRHDIDRSEAAKHEGYLCRLHNANLNTNVPGNRPEARSYYQKHKDRLRVAAREKYEKKKTEWKHPRVSSEDLKTITLKKCERVGHRPTQLTCEKHGITQEELNAAWERGGWMTSSSSDSSWKFLKTPGGEKFT